MGRRISRFKEPGYQEVIKLAGPYVGNESNALLLLNIAKMVDFANKGVEGIINAMCFNCMIGTVSAAIIERIKKDYSLPIITLVYSGSEYSSQKMILDAFINQVKLNKSHINQIPNNANVGVQFLRQAQDKLLSPKQ